MTSESGSTPLRVARNVPQLFVRLDGVEPLDNVRQLFHAAQKHPLNPVLVGENPWEAQAYSPTASIVFDESERLAKAWYMGLIGDQLGPVHSYGPHVLCYATSADGLRWERPELGLHEQDGSRANNIVVPATYHNGRDHWESVLIDPHDVNPQQRYKGIGWSSDSPGEGSEWCSGFNECGIYTMTSPDGLDWTHTPAPIVAYRPRPNSADKGPIGDAHSLMIDPAHGRYVAFLRGVDGNRMYCTSSDFESWSDLDVSLRPLQEAPRASLYNHIGFLYGNQYLGLVSYFHNSDEREHKLDVRLLTSRDGLHYEFAGPQPESRPALIPCGEFGDWDRFQTRITGAPPICIGDRLYIYYRGFSTSHDKGGSPTDTYFAGAVGLATLRKDGFASLAAGFDGGRVTTRPIRFEGERLLINAQANHFARVCVEVLDEAGGVLPGFSADDCLPMTTNEVAFPIRWRDHADLGQLIGRSVQLRFYLSNAQLYAYRIA